MIRTVAVLIIVFLSVTAHGSPLDTVVLGADEDEGMLLDPRQVEQGPDGNIYVLDAGDSHLKVYTPAGDFVRQIAGEGEGPGLFQRVDGAMFGFSPDGNLFFTEFVGGHRWLTRMKLSGELIGVVSLRREERFGLAGAAALADGTFLALVGSGFKPRPVNDYFLYEQTQTLVHLTDDGRPLAEIAQAQYATSISVSSSGGTFNIPYTPVFAWTVLADGTIAYADGMSRILTVFDGQGHVVREVETELPGPTPVSRADLDKWRRAARDMLMSYNRPWYENFGRVIEKYRASLYDKPNLVRLSTTPGGRILVEGPEDAETGQRDYWLLDSAGKVITQVELVAARMRISAGFILYLAPDEDGNTLVHCIGRKSTAAADLAALAGS